MKVANENEEGVTWRAIEGLGYGYHRAYMFRVYRNLIDWFARFL